MTGLGNRRRLQQVLERPDQRFSAVLLDVDRFRAVNDEHGHDAGDAVLRRIADLVQRNVGDDDIVVRYGADEFVVLVPGGRGAEQTAERLLEVVRKEPWLEISLGLRVTVSAGVAGRRRRPRPSRPPTVRSSTPSVRDATGSSRADELCPSVDLQWSRGGQEQQGFQHRRGEELPRRGRRPAHHQARRGRPDRDPPDPAPRPRARRGQGRAAHVVPLRGAAGTLHLRRRAAAPRRALDTVTQVDVLAPTGRCWPPTTASTRWGTPWWRRPSGSPRSSARTRPSSTCSSSARCGRCRAASTPPRSSSTRSCSARSPSRGTPRASPTAPAAANRPAHGVQRRRRGSGLRRLPAAGSAAPDPQTLDLLAALLSGEWAVAEDAEERCRREGSGLVAAFLQWHLERGIRSLRHVERPWNSRTRPPSGEFRRWQRSRRRGTRAGAAAAALGGRGARWRGRRPGGPPADGAGGPVVVCAGSPTSRRAGR